jgi:hypothetical protein
MSLLQRCSMVAIRPTTTPLSTTTTVAGVVMQSLASFNALTWVTTSYVPQLDQRCGMATSYKPGRPPGRPIQQKQRQQQQQNEKSKGPTMAEQIAELVMNEKIRGEEVRLIHEGKSKVVPIEEALQQARELGESSIQHQIQPPTSCRNNDTKQSTK